MSYHPNMRVALAAACVLYLVGSIAAVNARQAAAPAPRTVWDGVFTADQVERGRNEFAGHCAECHGGNLQGGSDGKRLSGDQFWTDWKESTVGELLTYVSKNMPRSEDGSTAGTLSPGTYADIVSYILSVNGFPSGREGLTAASSTGIQIIRKEGPGELPATTLAVVIGCLVPRAADGSWRVEKATAPVRSTTAGAPDKTASGDRAYAMKFVLTNLTKLVGQRVAVRGLLLGEGGVDGINVSAVTPLADTCQ
jgi:S-disulfanyl-L-cysteine oxidoreductase SoxD